METKRGESKGFTLEYILDRKLSGKIIKKTMAKKDETALG